MLYEEVIKDLEYRRNRVLSGKINCIPLPYPRFSNYFPGIEKGKYLIITANQKIGKSKFCDNLFVYEPLFYMINHPDELKIKVIYFTLEMEKKEKVREFMSYLLYKMSKGKIRISTQDLKSTNKNKPLSEEVLSILKSEEYKNYLESFNNMVEFVDDCKNPTGINKLCRAYALNHGKLIYKEINTLNELGEHVKKEVVDKYVPDDPEEYRIIIIDNASNLTTESGMDLRETINKMSKYCITLRDQLGFTPVLIQHQAQAQESLDNIKSDLMKPTSGGLADCKTTCRDCNTLIGLYSPYKFKKTMYEGYDITKLQNNIRFMEILEDRDNGAGNMICPLYFDGAVSLFKEMPKSDDDVNMEKIYKNLREIRSIPPILTLINVLVGETKKQTKIFKTYGNYLRNLWDEWRWKNHFNNH